MVQTLAKKLCLMSNTLLEHPDSERDRKTRYRTEQSELEQKKELSQLGERSRQAGKRACANRKTRYRTELEQEKESQRES